jgi:hypothetical protein
MPNTLVAPIVVCEQKVLIYKIIIQQPTLHQLNQSTTTDTYFWLKTYGASINFYHNFCLRHDGQFNNDSFAY